MFTEKKSFLKDPRVWGTAAIGIFVLVAVDGGDFIYTGESVDSSNILMNPETPEGRFQAIQSRMDQVIAQSSFRGEMVNSHYEFHRSELNRLVERGFYTQDTADSWRDALNEYNHARTEYLEAALNRYDFAERALADGHISPEELRAALESEQDLEEKREASIAANMNYWQTALSIINGQDT